MAMVIAERTWHWLLFIASIPAAVLILGPAVWAWMKAPG
jgi:hypothetical protein